jgi:metal-responsive CopG/Arc/MetJ family transcriptional regulator
MVMARREVLVQLDDDLVEALDRIAAERDTSRSDVLRRAARTLVEADAEAKADADLVAAYRTMPQDPSEDDMYLRMAIESWPEW